jgi:hypothetical protein
MSPRILDLQLKCVQSVDAGLRDGPSQDVESSYEGYGIRTLKVSGGSNTVIITISQLHRLLCTDLHFSRQAGSSSTHELVGS